MIFGFISNNKYGFRLWAGRVYEIVYLRQLWFYRKYQRNRVFHQFKGSDAVFL